MSCTNALPIDSIAADVRDALADEFVRKDRPIIDNGILSNPTLKAPSIRGDVVLDSLARAAFIRVTSAEYDQEIVDSAIDRLDNKIAETTGLVTGAIDDVILGEYRTDLEQKVDEQKLDTGITVTPKNAGTGARTQAEKNADYVTLEDYILDGEYIDNALDRYKTHQLTLGVWSGRKLILPSGVSRIKRSHDLSVLGTRLTGRGGRYATSLIADADGDYSAGYVLKLAPTEGSTINAGSGMEDMTLNLNEAPALGLLYQGAYDVSAMHCAEVINAHRDYPAALIEPHPNGTVIQTLKIDTCAFSKKQTGGTGHVVIIRKAQECLIMNSKFFGSPSNLPEKGSIPLLLEDCRGVQLIGGGYANSETHCIDIHAKTRSVTYVTIIAPTFEGFKLPAIRTRAEGDFFITKMEVYNPRLVAPTAGLLDASALTFSTLYANQSDVLLNADCENNTVYSYDDTKVTDNGRYNIVIGMPNTYNADNYVMNKGCIVRKASTPTYALEVPSRTGKYTMTWEASATVDYGFSIKNPEGGRMFRVMGDRLSFYGVPTVTRRISPNPSATDTAKIASLIQSLEFLGLFTPAPTT